MVYFTQIRPTNHYLSEHKNHVPWPKVIEIILTTKGPRKRGKRFTIHTQRYYVVFRIENDILYVINAKPSVIRMKCPNCGSKLQKVNVAVSGAKAKVQSFQCPSCSYFLFNPESSKKLIGELQQSPLKIRQKIVTLSSDRLGIYFNSHVVRSLNLKKGENIYVSVPDSKRIIIELEE